MQKDPPKPPSKEQIEAEKAYFEPILEKMQSDGHLDALKNLAQIKRKQADTIIKENPNIKMIKEDIVKLLIMGIDQKKIIRQNKLCNTLIENHINLSLKEVQKIWTELLEMEDAEKGSLSDHSRDIIEIIVGRETAIEETMKENPKCSRKVCLEMLIDAGS